MSEGDPENWAAVAAAIGDRVRELGWRQRELAERSHVSAPWVREVQLCTVERRRSPRTLQAFPLVLGWEPEHLDQVLTARAQQPGSHTASAAARSRLDSLELRLAEVAALVTELRSDIATVIGHAGGN